MFEAGDRIYTFQLGEKFAALYKAVRQQHPQHVRVTLTERILALDPGETTGVAWYEPQTGLVRVGQRVTKDLGQSGNWLKNTLDTFEIDHLRAEDYRVYEWKAQDHAWSPVHTIQWVGVIKYIAQVTETPHSLMMAQQAKQWWGDNKLATFGMNPVGLRHGRDALRHLLYYILFPNTGPDKA